MSNNNRHTASYSTSHIEKYRKGELTAAEMHELEEAALDDPFLADAIEGILSQPAPTLVEDLTDLDDRLNRRIAENARRRGIIVLFRRISVAAAVLLLVGIAYISLIRRDKSQPVVTAPLVAKPSPSIPLPDNSSTAKPLTEKTPADSAALAFNPATRHRPATGAKHPYATTDKATQPLTLTSPQSQPKSEGEVALDSNRKEKNDAEDAVLAQAQKDYSAKSLPAVRVQADTYKNFNFTSPANPLILNGKVIDYLNHPVAGAFLALNGRNGFSTTTDDQGQFQLRIHPRDTLSYLTVSMIGYDHTSLAVNALSMENLQNNIIRLQPSSANLNEVVVTGIGIKRKATQLAAPFDSDEKLDTLWQNAAPVIGRQAYLQYLEMAKKKLGVDSTIRGTETISFIVARDGKLTDFKIEQSISPAHDAGIYRLVTDGPGWIVFRGKKAHVSVTVNF